MLTQKEWINSHWVNC